MDQATKTAERAQKEKGKPRKRRKLLIILISIAVVLIVARIILPYIVLHYANKTLANMHGYYGHVRDIDLAPARIAFD